MDNRIILVVDNHPMFLEFMSTLLSNEGYTVHTASSGLEAMEILKGIEPDFIFVDLVMPHIDGERLCKLIREREKEHHPVLIVISATAKEEIGERPVPGFADVFIVKGPFAKMGSHILETLKSIIRNGEESLPKKVIGLEDVYHREITRELLITKKHKEIILDAIADGILELTGDYAIVFANPASLDILGASETDLLSRDFRSLFPESDIPAVEKALVQAGGPQDERKWIFLQRKEKYLRIEVSPSGGQGHSSFLIVIKDQTDHYRVEKALAEKEILLQELHHRVKNNLTMITSLINLQKDYVKNKNELNHLERLQYRVHSISLIHQELMGDPDLTSIGLHRYITQLVYGITSSILLPRNLIQVDYAVEDVHFHIDTLIPIGLIVTELITNAIEHGYPWESRTGKPREGRITIQFSKTNEEYRLSVQHDGIPFPRDLDFRKTDSLGLKLVCILTEQLEGTVDLQNEQTTEFIITFPARDV